jgi:hypothetical protein
VVIISVSCPYEGKYTERFGIAIQEKMETVHTSHESGKSNISPCCLMFRLGRKRAPEDVFIVELHRGRRGMRWLYA